MDQLRVGEAVKALQRGLMKIDVAPEEERFLS